MQQPDFRFHRSPNSDKPMGSRVFVGDRCIGFVWRAWTVGNRPAWVTRLTLTGPDLSTEPSKHAAALVLWRIAAVRDEQGATSEEQREAVPA